MRHLSPAMSRRLASAFCVLLLTAMSSGAWAAKPNPVYCDQLKPLNAEYKLCLIDETRGTDADDGYALLVDKQGTLRLPPEPNMRFDVKDPQTGKPWRFMLDRTRYYSYVGRAYFEGYSPMEFYSFDKLQESVLAYTYLFGGPGKVDMIPVPDGTYTLKSGKTIEIKDQLLSAQPNENGVDLLPFPFEAEDQ